MKTAVCLCAEGVWRRWNGGRQVSVSEDVHQSDRRQAEQGFSVLEAIIAAAILSAGLVALQLVFAAQIRATLGIERALLASQYKDVAVNVMTQQVREGRNEGQAALQEGATLIWQVQSRSSRRTLSTNSASSGRFDLELVEVNYQIEVSEVAVLSDQTVILRWYETRPLLPQ